MEDSERDYVGYKAPPKHSRFKKGNQEHLKRRKKVTPDLLSIAAGFVTALVPYREGRKSKLGSRVDVHLMKIETLALQGDLSAAATLLDLREDPSVNFKRLQRTVLVFPKEVGDL